MTLTWNHRIVKLKHLDFNGDPIYQFAEVYYEDGVPVAFGDGYMSSDTVEGLQEVADRLLVACSKPVINEEDMPEQEYADDGYDDER